ncbi:flagellin [Caproiciproducens sp. NJN-50]|uniref:flagellin N-terminal helical domain-containing protein n=1 Tax=Caproiciproducens sp. NJN-50 TaxID=2507162 RepID=UPI000FFE05F1|nr:flagellin [Caproiciproducens sp. NJN-50]QAT50704.1 flagellin [Caproiciproducens sp. NJN-50]
MRINHNIAALNASNRLKANDNSISKNLQKLSSGYRINSAADDAAGLAVSEKMRAQINGLNQAEDNAQNGISLIQTAEGGLNETESILQRMNTLAVESANGTYQDTDDRPNLQKEVTALIAEVNRIASSTNFNGTTLLDGTATNLVFQIGSDNTASQQVSLSIATMTATGLTIDGVDISTLTGAQTAIDAIKSAIKAVSGARADLGAMQNRLEHTTNNLSTMSENLTSAESTIRDVDMSSEMVDLTKNQILEQAATSMLAQANAQPQNVLSLLKG